MSVKQSDLNQRLARAIRERRVTLGLSQQALGKAIGVSFQMVQKYEKGQTALTAWRLHQIATALNWSVFMLLTLALGEQPLERRHVSDRVTLELMKRFSALKPNEQAAIVLLVRKLAEDQN